MVDKGSIEFTAWKEIVGNDSVIDVLSNVSIWIWFFFTIKYLVYRIIEYIQTSSEA